ncbi:MAG: hypothetical protein RLZZ628_2355 [Bacteroidota bacterium]|jgi:hypothetical protein
MIKFNLKIIIIIFILNILSFISMGTAQSKGTPALQSPNAPAWSLGIGVGVTSLPSVQLTYRLQDKIAIRGEYDYMGYNYGGLPLQIKGAKAALDIEMRLSRFVLLAHYTPFEAKRIGFTAGIAVFPSKTVTGTLHLADTLVFGEAIVTPDVLGTGQLKLGYATAFAPYLGFTIGRPIPAHQQSLRLDIGAYYGGKFAVKALKIDSNVFLKENESNASVLERNFNRLPSYYRMIPDVKLAWTIAINR